MVGKELMLHLIAHLINGYDTDPRINWLLDNTNIHIMPSMNPDGMSISREGQCVGLRGRYNSAGVDLNRNFPDLSLQDTHNLQPETQAVRKWIDSIPFVLSGNLHGGAMLVRYPYDASYGQVSVKHMSQSMELCAGTSESKTPDDDVFQHLSRTYSLNHPTMRKFSCERQQYQDGIVNGAKWYPFKGDMPDYTYIQGGCMEVTLELSCCKYPLAYQLRRFWLDNVKSLLRLLEESHRGVRGIIVDDAGYPVKNARLMVKGRYMPFRTSDRGEYWRILLPGRYTLMASSPEHNDLEVPMVIVEGQTTIVNMTLIRKSRSYYPSLDDSQLQKTVGKYSNYVKPNIDEDTTDNYLSPDNANGFERLSSYSLPGSQDVKEKDSSQSVAGYYQALYEAIRKLTTRDPKQYQQNNEFTGAPYESIFSGVSYPATAKDKDFGTSPPSTSSERRDTSREAQIHLTSPSTSTQESPESRSELDKLVENFQGLIQSLQASSQEQDKPENMANEGPSEVHVDMEFHGPARVPDSVGRRPHTRKLQEAPSPPQQEEIQIEHVTLHSPQDRHQAVAPGVQTAHVSRPDMHVETFEVEPLRRSDQLSAPSLGTTPMPPVDYPAHSRSSRRSPARCCFSGPNGKFVFRLGNK
ncbi:unnamed protein product [Ixodes hexagonus]